jgi:hypothetical protein
MSVEYITAINNNNNNNNSNNNNNNNNNNNILLVETKAQSRELEPTQPKLQLSTKPCC